MRQIQHQDSLAIIISSRARRSGLSFIALGLGLALAGCAQNNGNNAPTGTIGPNTLNVADAAIAGGDPSMALSVSQSILANDPDNVDALVHEGQAYYALDRCPPSEAAFQRALKDNPKSSDAEVGLGRCLLKVNPAQAEAAFLLATNDDPGNAAAFSDLGIARDLQGNYAGAASAYQQSLVINPGSTATAVNLGLSLALSGQGAEALQYLGPLATGPDATPKIREDYAAALVASGRDDDARQVLAVDMTSDQVNQAMAGYQSLISQSITNPPAPVAPAPTATTVESTTVTVAPIQPSSAPVPLDPPSPAPVAEAAPPPPPVVESAPPPAPPPVVEAAPAQQVVNAAPAPQEQEAPPPPSRKKAQPAITMAKPKPAPVLIQASAPVPLPPAPAVAPGSPGPEATVTLSAAAPANVPPDSAVGQEDIPASVPAPAPAVASSAPATNGHSAVQLASLNSEDAAHAEWRKVSAAAPGLFAGKSPDISKVEVGGQTYYRLRVSGFASHADAAQFCSQITSAGGTCMPANF